MILSVHPSISAEENEGGDGENDDDKEEEKIYLLPLMEFVALLFDNNVSQPL